MSYSQPTNIIVWLMDLKSSVLILKHYLIIAKAKVMALGPVGPLDMYLERTGVTPSTFPSRFITKRKVLRGEDLTSIIMSCYLMTFQ